MKDDTPEVSVVMSVYNAADYLETAIQSILTQENVSLELIVIDDGSTDGSPDILRRLAKDDNRVRLFVQANAGLTLSLIYGCQLARGEFIARQDADDVSLPDRLRKQRDSLKADESLAFVSCNAIYMGPNDEMLEQIIRPTDPVEATRQLLFEETGPPAHGSVMMRRTSYEFVGGYREQFYFAQDSDLWLRLGRVGQIKYLPETLYAWRVSPSGISTLRQAQQLRFGDLGHACHAAVLRGDSESKYLNQAAELSRTIRHEKQQPSRLCARAKAWGHYRIGTTLARQGDSRARDYFWQTIKSQPWHVRAWIRLFQSCL